MINNILSSLIEQESYKDYKRTWQEILNELLYKYVFWYYFSLFFYK